MPGRPLPSQPQEAARPAHVPAPLLPWVEGTHAGPQGPGTDGRGLSPLSSKNTGQVLGFLSSTRWGVDVTSLVARPHVGRGPLAAGFPRSGRPDQMASGGHGPCCGILASGSLVTERSGIRLPSCVGAPPVLAPKASSAVASGGSCAGPGEAPECGLQGGVPGPHGSLA